VNSNELDSQDKPGKTTDSVSAHPNNTHDGSFDQSYRPQGSLFVEFFCPSSGLTPKSGDLYSYDSTTMYGS
jgi:hypothetical protein